MAESLLLAASSTTVPHGAAVAHGAAVSHELSQQDLLRRTLLNKRLSRQGFLQQESSQHSVSVAQGAGSQGAAVSQGAASGAQQSEACFAFRRASSPPPQLLLHRLPKTFPPQLLACRREKSPPPQRPASAVVSVIASPAPIISANAAMPLTTVRFILNLQSSELGAIRIRTSWLWA